MSSLARLVRVVSGGPSSTLRAFEHNCKLLLRTFCKSSASWQKPVRIGCASGFWGDTAAAAPQLIHKGKIDFLVMDYLSEITMSLLTAAQRKMPEMGYAPDFVQVAVGPYLKDIKSKGIRVVSNAGGINPKSCAAALKVACKKAGVDLKIAVVTGDDLLPKIQEIKSMEVKDIDSGKSLPETITSMTAYLGAGSIVQALDEGADVVITGRCTDSALALGPLIHSFKWQADSFDLLAAGSLAGHLIECGAQATGGVFTDWKTVPDWHNMGFPIVECQENGDFVLSKPPQTGGLVSTATVAEQLLYEIGDPQNYILPDVVCDFSNVQLEQLPGDGGVNVSGAKGKPPTNFYKVSTTYAEGNRITVVCSIGGPKAAEKGRKTVEAILTRTRNMFKLLKLDDFTKVHVQILGAEDTYGKHATPGNGPREVVLWLAAHHNDKKALGVLAREIAPAGTGMAPGLTGIVGGRPKVSPVLKLFSFLYPKDKVQLEIDMDGKSIVHSPANGTTSSSVEDTSATNMTSDPCPKGSHSYRLEDLAYTRSGDKGNHANIGVIARDPSFLPYIREQLTVEAVDTYMAHVFEDLTGAPDSRVKRFEVPGINGLNFLLLNSLGGGGIASLRSDPQGKAFGQMLLDFPLTNLPKLK